MVANKSFEDLKQLLSYLAGEEFCYVTTTGRITGRPHRIEIWFGLNETTLYLMSGGRERSDWVKNMRRYPQVSVQIGKHTLAGLARLVRDPDEDPLARRLLATKYQEWEEGKEGQEMSEWARTALPVAIDLKGYDDEHASP